MILFKKYIERQEQSSEAHKITHGRQPIHVTFTSLLRGGPRRMGQDKFRRKSGCAKATQYDPRGSTAIVYFNTVQCSPKFMAIIVASTNIAVPYRYLDTAVASHAHGHA